MITKKKYEELIRGLEQQLWFFGQDTVSRKNNLLEKHGFYRYRTPRQLGSHRYQMKWGSRIVELHSFCVGIYGNDQDAFLYVRAHDQAYAYLGKNPPFPGRYRKDYLMLPSDKQSKQRFFEASRDFLEWLEEYESWVEETCGKHYRLECYDRYHRKWLEPDKAREWFREYRKVKSSAGILQVA